MRYLYCPCEFFPVTQQDICPVTQPDNRNSLAVHPDTQLSYRTPDCVITGVRLRNRTSCASVQNINMFFCIIAAKDHPFLELKQVHTDKRKLQVQDTTLWWRSSDSARPKLQLVLTILRNHCCARASKLHAQRRKSPRQSLTVKPNLFAQRIAVARKTRAKSLKHLFSLYNCRSRLEICTEVGE